MADNNYNSLSDEELDHLINQHQNKSGLLEQAGNLAGKFNQFVEGTRIPAFAGGLLQGAGDIGASLGNLVARPLGHPIPHPNLGQYLPNDLLTRGAFGAGQLAADIPLYSSGAGLLAKTTGIGSKAGLSGKTLQGAISGGLMGENEEGGRFGSALFGASLPVAEKAIKAGLGMRAKNIADKTIDSMKNVETNYKKQFNNIFSKAEERGYAGDFKAPKYDEYLLKRAGNKDYLYALEQYSKKPSLEAAHEAQSDLGKYIVDIGKPTNTLERKAKQEAKELASAIREHILKNLNRSGNTDLALDYTMARHGYKTDYVPYLKSHAINKYIAGKLTPKDFAKELAQDKEFKAKIGQYYHPEIGNRELMRKIGTSKAGQLGLGAALGSILGGAGFYGLAKLLK